MSSGIFVRLIISEGSNTLMNQLIIITDNSETAGTIIYPRLTSLGKDKRCIEAITVQPSNSDINEVRDQISVVNLKEFWIGTYPNLHVKLSKWWLRKQPLNAFSLMMENAVTQSSFKFLIAFPDDEYCSAVGNFCDESKKHFGSIASEKALISQFEAQYKFLAPNITDQIRYIVCAIFKDMKVGYHSLNEKTIIDGNANKLVQALTVAQKHRTTLSTNQVLNFQESIFLRRVKPCFAVMKKKG